MNLTSIREILRDTDWHMPAHRSPGGESDDRDLDYDFYVAHDDVEVTRRDYDAEPRMDSPVLHRNFLAPLSWTNERDLVLASRGCLVQAAAVQHHEVSYKGIRVETLVTFALTRGSAWLPMPDDGPVNDHGAPELHMGDFALEFARRLNLGDALRTAQFTEFERAATIITRTNGKGSEQASPAL